MGTASLTIDGRQIENPMAQQAQRFAIDGQELDVQSFIDEGNAMRAAQPPQQQAQPQQSQQPPQNPLEWWQGSPNPVSELDLNDPQIKKWQNDYFREFAQGFHQQEFNSLADYEAWMKNRRTAGPAIDGFIKKLGMQYMPRKLKDEYEQQSAISKAENQFKRTIDLQGQMASKIQDAITAGDLPEGVFFDPKTNGLNYKAPKKRDPAKERNALISQLGKLRSYKQQADLDGSEDESAIYTEEIQNVISQLRNEGQEGGGQVQLSEEDQQVYQWAQDNPNDPRTPAIMQMLQATYQPQQ